MSPALDRSSMKPISSQFQERLFGGVKIGDELPQLSYKVTATTVILGALASRDWRPMHHDKDFAIERNGVKDIFMNTPNQAAWFERYITDWSGPKGRLGRMKFQMKGSVFPNDEMTFFGKVTDRCADECGCGWITLDIELRVMDELKTSCQARIALPADDDDNPWKKGRQDWKP